MDLIKNIKDIIIGERSNTERVSIIDLGFFVSLFHSRDINARI